MKLRSTALLTGLLMLSAACSRPAATPDLPQHAPPPARPPVEQPVVTTPAQDLPAPASGCLAPDTVTGTAAFADGGTPQLTTSRVAVTSGLCVANTYTTPVSISLRLPSGTTEAALRAGLTVEGAAFTLTHVAQGDYNWGDLRLAEGKPGDLVKVTLTGPMEMAIHLTRLPAPAVAVDWKDKSGQWAPLPAGRTLPQEPVNLRFRLTGEPSLAELKRRIADAVKNPFDFKQIAPDLVEAYIPAPYPQLFFNFYGLSSKSGLQVQEMGAVVYTGRAPQLVSLDVRTGEERPLAEVPPDIQLAQLSPDGAVAAVLAMEPTSNRQHPYVVDTAKGRSVRIEAGAGDWPFGMTAHFQQQQVIFPAWFKIVTYDLNTGRVQEATSAGRQWGQASPDGRYIFGFTPDYGAAHGDRLAPVNIVLYDTQTGTEREIKHAVTFTMPFHDPAWLEHRWTPEGLLVLPDVLEAKNRIPTKERTVVVDPATAAVTPSEEPAVEYAGVPEWVPGPGGLGYDPQRSWNWQEVTVRMPDGATKTFGNGRVLGWTSEGRLLVVRWENAQYRRSPPGH